MSWTFSAAIVFDIFLKPFLAAVTIMAAYFMRHKFKETQYFAYDAKTESEIANLTNTQKDSFKIGAEASKSYQKQLSGLFQWQAYRSPKAYYAGFQAGLDLDNELINKVLKPKV